MVSIEKDKCTGCAICEKVCPHGVIAMNEGKANVKYEEKCIECGACQLNCAYDAIDVKKGTGCLYIIIKEDILRIKTKGEGCCC